MELLIQSWPLERPGGMVVLVDENGYRVLVLQVNGLALRITVAVDGVWREGADAD